MHQYGGLKALQYTEELAVECARVAERFPPAGRRLADQLRKAAHSAALNLAEGSARVSYRDYRRFLDTTHSSLREVQIALRIGYRSGYIELAEYERLEKLRDEASRTVYGIIRVVARKLEQGVTRRGT